MRNRVSQDFSLSSSKEVLRASRLKDNFCTFCPANHNENANGSKSRWGRKVAKKTEYTTGKHRKEIDWNNRPYWDLCDKHYDV